MKQTLILGIIVVCIACTYLYPHTMINPGELTAGHQHLKNNCSACHTPFSGISNTKCIACHNPANIGKDSTGKLDSSKQKLLFHQGLMEQSCSSCHTDHKGIAPTVSLSNFNHQQLSSAVFNNCNSCHNKPVDSLHQSLSNSCINCHNTQDWKLNVVFNHDMIQGADKNNCAACHQKPNDNFHQSTSANCSQCHSNNKWLPSSFDHSAYFRLDANHQTTCNTCHTNNNYKVYTCYSCHEHSPSNTIAKHNEEGIYNISNCASCHKSGSEHDINRNGKEQQNMNKEDLKKLNNYSKEEDD